MKTDFVKYFRVVMCLVGGGMGWSCQSPAPNQPPPPNEKYLYSDRQIQNEKHISVVNVPLEMPLAELEKQLNAQLTGLIYEDNSYENDDNDHLKAKVWKLSPIKVQAIDSTFLFEVPLKVWVSVGYNVNPLGMTLSGYKDTEFAVRIRFVSKIGITPDWRVTTRTTVDSYDWIKEPSIKVAGFTIPVKSMVSRTLSRNFEKITQAIDSQVEGTIELRKYIEQAWELARQPVLLSQEYETWLVVVPTEADMTPLVVKNDMMRTTIGIHGFTQTITSSQKPELRAITPLPPLKIVKQNSERFRVGLISTITYKEAARLAKARFVGEKFSFSDNRYTVEVTDIDLFGQNEYLVIKASLRGSMDGVIYLKGVPHYNPDTQNLSLRNVDYDLDTRNIILKTAGWLLQGKFSAMMEKQLVFAVGDQITEAQTTIQNTLSHNTVTKGIELNGTLADIKPDRVYLTPDHIYCVVFATGKASLRIQGFL